ncbi:hypothetical protein I6E74_02295 [Salinibacterium sp. SWN139]|nr:hypothetical protein [Salinibacterium sp. SWN139]MBH0052998.1 hypothetical protein [Salinibacterium sp. SWN139]
MIDHGSGRREAETTGEDPLALSLQPFVENVDGGHLGWGGQAGRIMDH